MLTAPLPSTRSRRTTWFKRKALLAFGALCTLRACPACTTPLFSQSQQGIAHGDSDDGHDAFLGGAVPNSDQVILVPSGSQPRVDATDDGVSNGLYQPESELSWLDSLPVVPESHRGHVYVCDSSLPTPLPVLCAMAAPM